MSTNDQSELLAEIESALQSAEKIYLNYIEFKDEQLPKFGKTKWSAMLAAKLLADFYTCCESLFISVSQHFENHLARDKWHSELLHKMGLSLPEMRPALLSVEAQSAFREIMAFRHFARYYFEMEYDWRKMDFLLIKLEEAYALFRRDVEIFRQQLN